MSRRIAFLANKNHDYDLSSCFFFLVGGSFFFSCIFTSRIIVGLLRSSNVVFIF